MKQHIEKHIIKTHAHNTQQIQKQPTQHKHTHNQNTYTQKHNNITQQQLLITNTIRTYTQQK